MRTAARRHTISNTTQLMDTITIMIVVEEGEGAEGNDGGCADVASDVASSVVVTGCGVVLTSVVVSVRGVVMMASGGHVEPRPWNTTSARYAQVEPGGGLNRR
jgi:hypothetical protein